MNQARISQIINKLDTQQIDNLFYEAHKEVDKIAEKLGWSRETISDDLESFGKNGKSAENQVPDLYLQCLTQQEIAEKLGWSEKTIERDLADVRQNGKSAEMSVPDLYLQCHTQEEIAEKLGWAIGTINSDLESFKNARSGENEKPDPLRFADVWSFTECGKLIDAGDPIEFSWENLGPPELLH